MNSSECDFTQARLTDYLDNTLEPTVRQTVESHLLTCARCEKELQTQRRLVDLLQRKKAPPLPDAFWQAFPEQVLAEYKTQRANTIKTTDHRRGFSFIRKWFATHPGGSWAAVLASGLLVGALVTVLLDRPAGFQSSPTLAWVNRIEQPQQLQQLVKQLSASRQSSASLAFARQAGEYNFFAGATLYVEALAMAAGHDGVTARQQLGSLQHTVAGILDSSQRQVMHELIKTIPDKVTLKPKLLNSFATLEKALQQAAIQQGPQQALYWETGLTISRLGLAAQIKDLNTLRQFTQLDALQQRLAKTDIPPGVLDAIGRIHDVIKRDTYSAGDLIILNEQVARIQLVIG